ncbi:MAG: hypothetical protein ACOX8E_05680 [Ruminococcus sp.]|jgi:hypothetical protein
MTLKKRVLASALFLLLLVFLFICLSGCSNEKEEAVTDCIARELKPLKSSNTEEISSYFAQAGLLSDLPDEKLPEDVADVFLLFFQDFDYSIKDITISEDGSKASALLEFQTLDAKTLAKDFVSQTIETELQNQAMPSRVEYSLEDYYRLLGQLLQNNDYGTVKSEYTVSLTNEGGQWSVTRDEELDNVLTGNFVTYGADPDLLTSEEVIALYFDTIKSFDTEQINRFLDLDELFSADDEYKRTIAKALAGQILQYLDYSVTGSESDGITSEVTVDVTTCDWNSIIQKYREEVAAYTSTSQALADGMSVRLTKANQILLDCIDNNTSSSTTSVTLTLENDGTNWKLQTDDVFVEAILGNVREAVASISTSPET